jgi:hypothetical protein
MEESEHQRLIKKIEKECHLKEANSAYLVHEYEISIKDRPVVTLLQDIDQRIGIYKNLLEQIKGAPLDYPQVEGKIKNIDDFATELKRRYEDLGLIPKEYLPNPTASKICEYITDKMSRFATLIIDILAKYSSRIVQELRLPSEVTVTFQAGLGWSVAQVTVGIERSREIMRPTA